MTWIRALALTIASVLPAIPAGCIADTALPLPQAFQKMAQRMCTSVVLVLTAVFLGLEIVARVFVEIRCIS